jgi:hypothetical protein
MRTTTSLRSGPGPGGVRSRRSDSPGRGSTSTSASQVDGGRAPNGAQRTEGSIQKTRPPVSTRSTGTP